MAADKALAPTHWQASSFPEWFQDRITVVHDGVDTDLVRPNPDAQVDAAGHQITFRPGDEVLTFVNRNLEPYRGYHIFMRALPKILKARPNARVIIVGADHVSYGAAPGRRPQLETGVPGRGEGRSRPVARALCRSGALSRVRLADAGDAACTPT